MYLDYNRHSHSSQSGRCFPVKKTASVFILITAFFTVFLSGLLIGRHSGSSVPLANIEHLIPTKPFEPEFLPTEEIVGSKININTASVETLAILPGIGIDMATKIVDYREQNGPFMHTEELRLINGMGEKHFNDLAKYITVGE